MLTVAFFLYNLITLYIAARVSIRLKDVKNVEKVTYLNNIALLLVVAVLTMSVSSAMALKVGCSSESGNISYNVFSLSAITFLNLFLDAMYIAIIANEQFKNTPKDVQNLLITALVLNIIGTFVGVGLGAHYIRKASLNH